MRRILAGLLAAAFGIVYTTPSGVAANVPPCVGGVCVKNYSVSSEWVQTVAGVLRSLKRTGKAPSLTVIANPQANSVTITGNQPDVALANSIIGDLNLKPAPDSPTPEVPQVCVIDNVSPAAATSIVGGIVSFLSGGSNVSGATPTPAPTPSGSPPAATPAPVNFSAKNGSVVLDSSQSRIILHLLPSAIGPLKQALSRFSNAPASSQRFATYDVRYGIPDPIPASTALPVNGELSSAPSMTYGTSSVQALATTVAAMINQAGQSDVRISPDPTYPRILLAGSPGGVNEALALLDSLDKRPAMIEIQLTTWEIDNLKARDLGVQIPNTISASVGAYIAPTGTAAAPILATPAPIFHGKIVTAGGPTVPFNFNTLMEDDAVRMQSSPRIETLNGRLTVFDVGQIIPFTANTLNSQGALVPGIANYTIGTHLEVIPLVNFDGSISVYIHPINSTLTGYTLQNAPQIDRRELSQNFRLAPQQAVFISGLKEDQVSDVRDQIPGLSLIPWLGKHMFGNRNASDTRTDFFIQLTAKITDPGELTYQNPPNGQALTPALATPSPQPTVALKWSCAKGQTPPSTTHTQSTQLETLTQPLEIAPAGGGRSPLPEGPGSPVPAAPLAVPTALPISSTPAPLSLPTYAPLR